MTADPTAALRGAVQTIVEDDLSLQETRDAVMSLVAEECRVDPRLFAVLPYGDQEILAGPRPLGCHGDGHAAKKETSGDDRSASSGHLPFGEFFVTVLKIPGGLFLILIAAAFIAAFASGHHFL